jgi:hypothetical protein
MKIERSAYNFLFAIPVRALVAIPLAAVISLGEGAEAAWKCSAKFLPRVRWVRQ